MLLGLKNYARNVSGVYIVSGSFEVQLIFRGRNYYFCGAVGNSVYIASDVRIIDE